MFENVDGPWTDGHRSHWYTFSSYMLKMIVFHSLKINFVLANCADPDKMLHYPGFLPFAKVPVYTGLNYLRNHKKSKKKIS